MTSATDSLIVSPVLTAQLTLQQVEGKLDTFVHTLPDQEVSDALIRALNDAYMAVISLVAACWGVLPEDLEHHYGGLKYVLLRSQIDGLIVEINDPFKRTLVSGDIRVQLVQLGEIVEECAWIDGAQHNFS